MRRFQHKPDRWDRWAHKHWKAGRRSDAIELATATLQAMAEPDADAFIQPAFYLDQAGRHREAADLLERGVELFSDHPMILLCLGTACTRSYRHHQALPYLERFLDLGYLDATVFDALSYSYGVTGDLAKAKLFGTISLSLKDKGVAERHGLLSLDRSIDPTGKAKVIAFTLFGSDPRYLRGALHNLMAARDIYPGWTCRFYVDSTVDRSFLKVLAEEGADLVHDESSGDDLRRLLTRRFLVSDDLTVGHFIVRDCDSVVSSRERAAVDQWLDSGFPFHIMRDWYTHTDVMLAGMWGGTAGVFPDMGGTIERFLAIVPVNSHWDQHFQREEVWPAIRDDCLVHDRFFGSHRAQPFPTPVPPDPEHVGHNQFAVDKVTQARALMPFLTRLPVLGLDETAINIRFRSQL